MPALTMGSLFDGIGVFPLAASRHGIVPVWASEFSRHDRAIRQQNSSGRCDHVFLTLSKFLANWRQIRHSRRKIKPVLSGN